MGITQDSLSIMEEEGIVNETILRALRREHIHKLLEVMKVGQHALLLEVLDYGGGTKRRNGKRRNEKRRNGKQRNGKRRNGEIEKRN